MIYFPRERFDETGSRNREATKRETGDGRSESLTGAEAIKHSPDQ